MSSLRTIILVLLCFQVSLAEQVLQPERTFAVVVGVLSWADQKIPPFPTEGRQDVVFRDALLHRGLPQENIRLLLDEDATWAAIKGAFKEVGDMSRPGDTLIFYYAGHGFESPQGIRFVEYDAPLRGGFPLPTLGEVIRQSFQGEQVLLFADCCFSGGLGDLSQELSQQGFQGASVTSAPNCAPSGPTWAYTMTLIDAFRGARCADQDLDHKIRLEELHHEVRQAMKFSAGQVSGADLSGLTPQFVLSYVTSIETRPHPPEPFRAYEYVEVRVGKNWRSARIIGFEDDLYQIRLQEYAERPTFWVPGELLRRHES